jgi:hypothetical protein
MRCSSRSPCVARPSRAAVSSALGSAVQHPGAATCAKRAPRHVHAQCKSHFVLDTSLCRERTGCHSPAHSSAVRQCEHWGSRLHSSHRDSLQAAESSRARATRFAPAKPTCANMCPVLFTRGVNSAFRAQTAVAHREGVIAKSGNSGAQQGAWKDTSR